MALEQPPSAFSRYVPWLPHVSLAWTWRNPGCSPHPSSCVGCTNPFGGFSMTKAIFLDQRWQVSSPRSFLKLSSPWMPGLSVPRRSLRKSISPFLSHGFPARLLDHVQNARDSPIFRKDKVAELRGIAGDWFCTQGWDADQPYCLRALNALGQVIRDPDASLFPCLSAGVPTGVPPSLVFPAAATGLDEADVAQ